MRNDPAARVRELKRVVHAARARAYFRLRMNVIEAQMYQPFRYILGGKAYNTRCSLCSHEVEHASGAVIMCNIPN